MVGFDLLSSEYSILSDLSGDGNLDLVARTGSGFKVYDTTSTPFTDITAETIPETNRAYDVVSADFNGDLMPDLYLTEGINLDDLYQNDSDNFTVRLVTTRDSTIQEKGVRFKTTGDVTFNLFSTGNVIDRDQIYIGAGEFQLNPDNFSFTLSPDDPRVQGIASQEREEGLYIGYNSVEQEWQLQLPSGQTGANISGVLVALVEATESIDQLTSIGFPANPLPPDDQLLINTAGGFIDQSEEAGINSIPVRGRSVVAGDFDNDMDLDLYIVTSRPSVLNTPNILYENQGDGTFIAVPEAGGAAGTELGEGDIVITADYDLDGFLDLLVGNGGGLRPLVQNAPYQLFRNQGNENHWLEIDLQGRTSNRDGIGVQIFATAGGVTQLREQSGGIHDQVQNHQRIHFGLADNTRVEELVINWPSGKVQTIKNIPANRLIQVIEPGDNEDDRVIGQSSNDIIFTGNGHDLLRGASGDDLLESNEGNDTLIGGMGNDILDGGAGDDNLRGKEGDDFVRGAIGDDILKGNEGNDTLRGGGGDDRLKGGRGDDILISINSDSSNFRLGAGELDTLTGGSGSDTFVLADRNGLFYDDGDALTMGTNDLALITDFDKSEDTIQLQGSAELYRLDFLTSGGITNARLFFDSGDNQMRELIAILENVNPDLTINDSAFTFV